MNLHKLILTNNDCYKVGQTIAVKGIMVHSTGANNPMLKRYVGPDDGLLGVNQNNNHWNQSKPGGRQVCVHGFIGKLANGNIATYQTLPWNHRGWHAGGAANNTHIGFEICEDGLTNANYFNAVYKEAAELCAYLCKKFKLDPLKDGVIIGHFEGYKRGIASNHGDPNNWFPRHGKSMDTFRKYVKELMGGATTSPVTAKKLYRVQCGALTQKANAIALESKLKAKGHKTIVVQVGKLWKVQCGAFEVKANADKLAATLKSQGFDTFIVTE